MQTIKGSQKISTLFLFLIFLAFAFFAFLFFSRKDIAEEEHTKQIASHYEREEILHYLEEEVLDANFEGKIFADFYEFGAREEEAFIWAYIAEYYIENGKIKQGTALSAPLAIILSTKNRPLGHRQAGSGRQHKSAILRIFPEKYHEEILNFTSDSQDIIEQLKKSTEEKSREYF